MAYRKLGRTSAQRKAMLRDLATDLIINERIETTETRAKELRSVVEKMITQVNVETYMHVVKLLLTSVTKQLTRKLGKMLFRSYLLILRLVMKSVKVDTQES